MKHYIAISATVYSVALIARKANWTRHTATNYIRNCLHRHNVPISNAHMRRLIIRAYS